MHKLKAKVQVICKSVKIINWLKRWIDKTYVALFFKKIGSLSLFIKLILSCISLFITSSNNYTSYKTWKLFSKYYGLKKSL